MRMIVICLCLGTLIWELSQETDPNLMMSLGLIALAGLTLTRLFKRNGIPAFLGAVTGGLLLGQFLPFEMHQLQNLNMLNAFMMAWLGLVFSAQCSKGILKNTRLLKSALCLFAPGAALTFLFLTLQDVPRLDALKLALFAGISPIIFLPHQSNMRGEMLPLAKLTALFGILIWLPFEITINATLFLFPYTTIGLALLSYFALLEGTVQVFKQAQRTATHQITVLCLAFILALASLSLQTSALYLVFVAGLYLNLRGISIPATPHGAFSETVISFGLAYFSLSLITQSQTLGPEADGANFVLFMSLFLASRTAGGLLAHHFYKVSPKAWLPLLPAGYLFLWHLDTTPIGFFSSNRQLSPSVLLIYAAILLIHPICAMIWRKLKKGTFRTAQMPERA